MYQISDGKRIYAQRSAAAYDMHMHTHMNWEMPITLHYNQIWHICKYMQCAFVSVCICVCVVLLSVWHFLVTLSVYVGWLKQQRLVRYKHMLLCQLPLVASWIYQLSPGSSNLCLWYFLKQSVACIPV